MSDPALRTIPLTQGQSALVDAEDYNRIAAHKWAAAWSKGTQSFYALRTIRQNGRNGDGLTLKTRRHHNTKGIQQIKNGRCEESLKRIAKHLGIPYAAQGSHATPSEAPRTGKGAYDAAARQLHGEFARCNFPEVAA